MLSTFDIIACVCALATFFWLAKGKSSRSALRSKCRQLPGSSGLPIIGNLLDIPDYFPSLVYRRLGRIYDSNIVQLNALGNNIVVVNSVDLAMELFERRSSMYSDRPQMTMLNELVGAWWGIAFRRYGSGWRDTRKAFHLEFHPTAVTRFRPVEEEATRDLLTRLLIKPAEFTLHIRQ